MKTMIVAMSVLALAAVASAEVGDLEFVDPADVAAAGSTIQVGPNQFAKPAEGSGCVHPQAVVATVQVGSWRTGTFCVAVDARKADAKAADVLRFDFTGRGKFDDKNVVDMKLKAGEGEMTRGTFGAAVLTATRNDGPVKVKVAGQYAKQGLYRSLSLNICCVKAGSCAFGDKKCAIRLIDANGNLAVSDKPKPTQSGGWVVLLERGDVVQIDPGDGKFAKDVVTCRFGQTICLDGKLWTLAVSPDGKKVSAKEADGQFGQVRLPAESATCVLVGDDSTVDVSGNKPVFVPAGKYYVMAYNESSAPNAEGKIGSLTVNNWGLKDDAAKKVEVAAGKTVDLKVGSPLTAKAGVPAKVRPGSSVQLSLVLTDQGGNDVSSVNGPDGDRPPKPRVDILNDKGEKVYSSTLEYG